MPEDLHRAVCAEVLAALQHHSNVNDHWCLSWSMKSVGGCGGVGVGWGVRRSGSGSSSRCSSSGGVSGRGNSSRDVVVGGGGSGKP